MPQIAIAARNVTNTSASSIANEHHQPTILTNVACLTLDPDQQRSSTCSIEAVRSEAQLETRSLQKRSPVDPYAAKYIYALDVLTRQKADSHHVKAIRNPQGRLKETTGEWIHDGPRRDIWSDRRTVIFNKDYDHALLQQKHYNNVYKQSSDPEKRRKATSYENMWFRQNRASRDMEPLYRKHTDELINHLQTKVHKYQTEGNNLKFTKWQDRLDKVATNDIEALKLLEREYHTKALKARQNQDDWTKLYAPKMGYFYGLPRIEEYSTPDKKSLDVSLSDHGPGLHSNQKVKSFEMVVDKASKGKDLRMLKNSYKYRQAYLPEPGHATNRQRIEEKIHNAESDYAERKWRNRRLGINQAPLEYRSRRGDVLHYRNKEVGKRWNQLHYASAARQAEMRIGKEPGNKRKASYALDEQESGSGKDKM